MVNLTAVMEQLRRPFAPSDIEWKPGATKGDRCMALAYGDLRAYMEALDEAVGEYWSVSYEPWGDSRIICTVTILGVSRSSTGEQDNTANGGTVAEAQAFKRACAMFGLGRFLYNLPQVWVGFDPGSKRITDAGLKELNDRYSAWYHKTLAKLEGSNKSTSESTQRVEREYVESSNKSIQDAPMGKPGDIWGEDTPVQYSPQTEALIVKYKGWAARDMNLHPANLASPAQYRFLSGEIDRICAEKGSHNRVLYELTGYAADGKVLTSKTVASDLLDCVLKTTKDRDTGEVLPNPRYDAEVEDILLEIATLTPMEIPA
jgi:hypothetical protein